MFVTFEGSEGVGKTTIIEQLKTKLAELGYSVFVSREPGGDPLAEKIRKLLLDKDGCYVSDATEALLFAASRASHLDNVIKPNLNKYDFIILDRYIDSSVAYQGYGRGLGEDFIYKINSYALDTMPQLTFFLDMNIEEGLNRLKSRGKVDRLDLLDTSFYHRVREGYLNLSQKEDRIVVINTGKSSNEAGDKILKIMIDKYVESKRTI